MMIFVVKKQRTNAKSERSKGRGLAICRRRKMYAMIGVELRPCVRVDLRQFLRTDPGDWRPGMVVTLFTLLMFSEI